MPVRLAAASAHDSLPSTATHKEQEPTRPSEQLTVPVLPVDAPTPSKFNTEYCRYFARRGFCRNGRLCAFAHEAGELYSPPQSSHAALVEEVWSVQRKSFAHRNLRHSYCDEHFAGTRDPSWRSSEDLRAFLDLPPQHLS